jgi:hypothetical protein
MNRKKSDMRVGYDTEMLEHNDNRAKALRASQKAKQRLEDALKNGTIVKTEVLDTFGRVCTIYRKNDGAV